MNDMKRISTQVERPYRSPLRAQQAEETRARILDATARVMATGIATVSIPAVAKDAGVSVPTIYRHFGTKDGLLAAVYPHLVRRAGLDTLAVPTSMQELLDGMRDYVERVESFDDLARAAMASPAADESRRIGIHRRYAAMRQVAGSIVPGLRDADRDRVARLLLVLTATSALRLLRDQLGASVEEATEDIEWTIRAAVAAATSEARE
jgi:AcrR family transcriptional regulator